MSRFEVLFSATKTFPEISMKIEADSWFQAFESAVTNLGKQELMKSIFCDVRPDGNVVISFAEAEGSVTVTELTENPHPQPEEKQPVPPQSENQHPTPATDQHTAVEPESFAPISEDVPPESHEISPEPTPEPEPKPFEPAESKTPEEELSAAELFEEIMDIYDYEESDALAFAMDLAMKYIPSESGSIALADRDNSTLTFEVTRGPKAEEVQGLTIHFGQGLLGFSAKNGSLIAVNEVAHDPRFFKGVSETVDYETKSLMCAPILHPETEIVFGVIELINKKNGAFTENELNLLKFIADKTGEFFGSLWDAQNNSFDE